MLEGAQTNTWPLFCFTRWYTIVAEVTVLPVPGGPCNSQRIASRLAYSITVYNKLQHHSGSATNYTTTKGLLKITKPWRDCYKYCGGCVLTNVPGWGWVAAEGLSWRHTLGSGSAPGGWGHWISWAADTWWPHPPPHVPEVCDRCIPKQMSHPQQRSSMLPASYHIE